MNFNFEEFKNVYMSNFDGYIPTYISADENFYKPGFILLKIEMIAPFRMTDGPSRFFRVIPVEVTPDEYEKIKQYMSNAGDYWKDFLEKKSVECLGYSNNFK